MRQFSFRIYEKTGLFNTTCIEKNCIQPLRTNIKFCHRPIFLLHK